MKEIQRYMDGKFEEGEGELISMGREIGGLKKGEEEKKNMVTCTYKEELGRWITVLSGIVNRCG
ncbi:hypothetical protein, partial [Priestia megaterium]|uniref:hypothetical protein n=1 Tax=Priestia megaterium TaxID=1404 RepID=UPI00119EC753